MISKLEFQKKRRRMNCANCRVLFVQSKDVYKPYKKLFYDTCNECIQTCTACGFESGYLKKQNGILSGNPCDECQKEGCRHCGVILNCRDCNSSYCESCIDDGKVTCQNIIAKKARIMKYK